MSPICNRMFVDGNQLVYMVIGENVSNNYGACLIRNHSSQYNSPLQNTRIFWKLHRMGGKSNTMTQIYNLMIVLCNQLVCMVIVNDASINFDSNKIINASMEYNSILSRIYQYSQISTNWDDKGLPCHQYATECLLTLTNLCIWSLGRMYLTMMEPV
jgi:hypothetical protein